MTHYTGGCHCGGIAYEVDGEIEQVLDCNCSMCGKRGGLLWFVPRAAFDLKTPESNYRTYTFNTHKLEHHFCPTCGISPFTEGTAPDGTPMVAINARCLEGVEPASLKIVQFDGRSR
jgi:hypothetical protein